MGIFNSILNKNNRKSYTNYNRVFERQIRKVFGDAPSLTPELEELFLKISKTYDDFQKDKLFLQNTTDISIKELRQVNESYQKSEAELSSTKTELVESQKLASISKELQLANENLKNKQKEVEKAYNEIKETQDQLILSEKMASLGQLTAGVAHEINTPLSVINGSIVNLNDSLFTILDEMPSFFKNFDQKLESTFLNLLRRSSQNTKGDTISTKEEREIRKNLTDILMSKDIPDARSIARNLVRVGLHEDIDEFIPLLNSDKSDNIVDMVLRIGRLQSNVNNMDIAVQKMQKIVFSLKNYSHFQVNEESVKSDIILGIETVLTLYNNKMKEGVEVVRDYQSKEIFLNCLSDQLDQVWTNIIHNALQAMNYNGVLKLAVNEIEDFVYVKISDNGPGIPQEILGKILNPFFTTKAQGEGSGLGLSICKKIIDKHQGELLIDSKAGDTTFTIKLPKKLADKN